MKKIAIVLAYILTFTACNSSSKSSRKADLKGIDLEVKIERFDLDLLKLRESKNLSQSLDKFMDKYKGFAGIYFSGVVHFGNQRDLIAETLPKFFADSTAQTLYADAMKQFPNFRKEEKLLTEAFRRGKFFFPTLPTPRIISCVSLLNQNLMITEEAIAIGIDKYLGADYPLYAKDPNNYDYVIQNWRPEKISPDIIYAWLFTEFPYERTNDRLIDELIYHGKILYMQKLLLPDVSAETIMGYTQEQWQWCIDQEQAMWKTLISEQHLFSTDHSLRLKYIKEAPFTLPFTQESPGRAGQFIGLRIVEAYMAKNQDITPQQLMKIADGQQILEQSGYNP